MNRRKLLQDTLAASLLPSVSFCRTSTAANNSGAIFRTPSKKFTTSLTRLMDVAMLPGVGIGIVSSHQLIWSYYAGVADAQSRTPITQDSIFPGCSLGKPLFAYAVLRLVDDGKLDLDRPLVDYLTMDAPTGEFGARVTARHVLSHTTGFVNWRQGSDEKLISAFEPGTRFQYSGEGFYTLQRCVEKISGTGFEQFMQDYIMKPLGMQSSTYLWRSEATDRVVSGHNSTRQPIRTFWEFNKRLFNRIRESNTPLARWDHERIVRAMTSGTDVPMPNSISPNVAFSLLTTVSDYALIAARLAAPAKDSLDLRPVTRALIGKPSTRINSVLSWGMGIGIEKQAGRSYLWQWGDNGYWKNFLLIHPASGSAVVIFTNGSNGMRVVERIVNEVSGITHDAFLWV
jgi:CubicO group peptidase (beta-lactamase class C family)